MSRFGHAALLIAGPTASGKTSMALDLAAHVDGEIVNADSMQVYADLRVLSARPSAEEEARAPHHMFGHVDAAVRYSSGQWLSDALEAMDEIRARGRTPIFVGGTGLYYRCLTMGLAEIPEVSDEAQARAGAVLAEGGQAGLLAEARRLDPEGAARVAEADRQRLLRIVAVGYQTGEALSRLQARTAPPLAAGGWRGAVLTLPTPVLNARIERRLELMLELGGLEEATALTARGLDPDLPAMKALGVSEFAALAAGQMTRADALERAAARTRQYAKRQRTWFRNQTPDWPRVEADPPDAADALARALGVA